jgi:hypothetical protein
VLTAGASGVMACAASGASQWTTSGSDIHFATGKASIGTTTIGARLTVSDDATIPTALTGTAVHAVGTTAQATRFFADSFAAIAGFGGRRANGVPGTPSALLSGQAMVQFGAFGYGASAYSTTAKAGMTAFAGGNWSNTDQPTSLVLFTTPVGSTTEAAVLTLDPSGLANFAAGVSITGAASAVNFNGTGSNPFRVSGTGVIDSSRNLINIGTANISGVLTLGSTLTADLIPTTDSVYVIGNSSFQRSAASIDTINAYTVIQPDTDGGADLGTSSLKFANTHLNTLTIYATIIPDATNSRQNGSTSRRWSKTWTQNLDVTGTITPPSGTAFTGTKVVKNSAGANCNMDYSEGIALTSSTC